MDAVERAWLQFVASYPDAERVQLRQALAFAQARHQGQTRTGSSTPYWLHLVRVALELARWGQATPEMVGAALLHDTVEDTHTSIEEIRSAFGNAIAIHVDWMTAPPGRERTACALYYEDMLRNAPPATHILKLADRTDNLRSIQALLMRTGARHHSWARTYLERTGEDIVPLAVNAPSIARVTLVTAMADMALVLESGAQRSEREESS